jgi:cell division protein FtsW
MFGAGYRRDRLFAFLSGAEDCLNTAYQTCQGLVALGSGRIFGLGLGSSRQKYLYLPNPDTDFIFAILGEETGLVGALTVLMLFALLLALGIRAARRARDPFGFLLAAGVTAWITFQVLVNVGAVTGVLPITGVPLPLISFGGTSLLVSLAGLGLVASVARRGIRIPHGE